MNTSTTAAAADKHGVGKETCLEKENAFRFFLLFLALLEWNHKDAHVLCAFLSNPKMSHPIRQTFNRVLAHIEGWTVAIIWKLFLWQRSILRAEYGACRRFRSRLVGAWGEVGCSSPTEVLTDPQSINGKSGGNVLLLKQTSLISFSADKVWLKAEELTFFSLKPTQALGQQRKPSGAWI